MPCCGSTASMSRADSRTTSRLRTASSGGGEATQRSRSSSPARPVPTRPRLTQGAPPRAIHDVVLRGNEIWGGLVLQGVERATVSGNRFLEPGAAVTIRDNIDATVEDNVMPPRE